MNFRNLPRRHHSAELKREVLAQCEVPGASVAAIAQAHGLNANLVHRWRRNDARVSAFSSSGAVGEFVPLAWPTPPPPCAPATSTTSEKAPPSEIRVELRRGASNATIIWPLAGAAQCGEWLRE
ncbi:IS66-like element accessory protein TnpA [Variovorax sp. RHLX14]|uniref:IS66-like element accessory protein TnpA n=1 Tax=Variovorax sp. RHLX14 TaxID=1259731 RepID=UPI003F472D0B